MGLYYREARYFELTQLIKKLKFLYNKHESRINNKTILMFLSIVGSFGRIKLITERVRVLVLTKSFIAVHSDLQRQIS